MITLQVPEGERCDGCMFLDAGQDGRGYADGGIVWAQCRLFNYGCGSPYPIFSDDFSTAIGFRKVSYCLGAAEQARKDGG